MSDAATIAPPSRPRSHAAVDDALVAELRGALAPDRVHTGSTELGLYKRDASNIEGRAGVVCFPVSTAEVAACVRLAVAAGRAVRRPRLGHRAHRRGDAARRRGGHHDDEDEPGAVGRPGAPPGVGRAGRAQPRPDPPRRRTRPALRARPEQPAELQHRRQRRQQLRRPALPGRRGHRGARARRRGRAARRLGRRARRRGSRAGRLRPARRVRRQRGDVRHRHEGLRAAHAVAARRAHDAVRLPDRRGRARRPSARSSPPAWCRPRWR